MHGAVRDYVRGVLKQHPPRRGARVLEFGSYNVNGTARDQLPGARWVGVDQRGGPGVDWVGLASDYVPPAGELFDLFVCLEMLEHDPGWRDSLVAGWRALRPGGLWIVTCAGPGREPHELDCGPEPGYYRNLAVADLVGLAGEHQADLPMRKLVAAYRRNDHDLQAHGIMGER